MIAQLSKVRAEQLRRLQVCALACDGLVFLCRRVLYRTVHLLRRRDPLLQQPLVLPTPAFCSGTLSTVHLTWLGCGPTRRNGTWSGIYGKGC